jgi:hypothetical protein
VEDVQSPTGADAARLGQALGELALTARYTHPDDLPVVIGRAARHLGAHECVVYIADLGQRELVPLYGREEPDRPALAVEGTLAGRAYQSEEIVQARGDGDRVHLWVPVQDSAERLGVVALELDEVTPGLEWAALAFAAIVAEYVVTKSRYGDALERTRRRRPLTLPAEMRWTLLPPLTYHSPAVTVTGLVEPSYGIAGDTFDYALVGDRLHLALFDAVGHGLLSCRVANLTVSAYRNSRRAGRGLGETYEDLDHAVAQEYGDSMFVASLLATLRLDDGTLVWVNGGQPRPLLLRGGQVVEELELQPTLPVGLEGEVGPIGERRLQPGDTVVLFTDGVTEARSPEGDFFGEERLIDHISRAAAAGTTPPETLRRLVAGILEHQQDRLQDDLTVVLVTWHGPPPAPPSIADELPPLPI